MLTILSQLKGEDTWEEITLAECLEKTEGAGFWAKGTVEKLLDKGLVVDTPWSSFKKKE